MQGPTPQKIRFGCTDGPCMNFSPGLTPCAIGKQARQQEKCCFLPISIWLHLVRIKIVCLKGELPGISALSIYRRIILVPEVANVICKSCKNAVRDMDAGS